MQKNTVIRHPGNPVLTAADVPYDATLVFNAGVCKWHGVYYMVFRNDYGPRTPEDYRAGIPIQTNLGLAKSPDGVNWEVAPRPVFSLGGAASTDTDIRRAYDPRLTVLDDRIRRHQPRHPRRPGRHRRLRRVRNPEHVRTRQPEHGHISRADRR